MVPANARVEATPDEVRVDSVDGAWWFDARWVDVPGPVPPLVPATAWGEERCRPLRWDQPAEPVEGTWTAGGFCTIDGRRYWVLTAVERRDGRMLLTGMIASRTFVTYEDLWVTFVTNALSLTSGEVPLAVPTPAEVRTLLRTTDVVQPGGTLPRPGGGVFSRVLSDGLKPLWALRAAAAMPAQFVPPQRDAPPTLGADGAEQQGSAGGDVPAVP